MDDWEFDVDITGTRNYYDTIIPCDCDPCSNFQRTVQKYYPQLDPFLSQFGICITHPEECCWWEGSKKETSVSYVVYYTLNGEVISESSYEIDLDQGIHIVVQNYKKPDKDSSAETSYFVFGVFNIELPWTCDSDFYQCFKIKEERKGLYERFIKGLWLKIFK